MPQAMIDMSRGELHADLCPADVILDATKSVHQASLGEKSLTYGNNINGDLGLIHRIRELKSGFSAYGDDEFLVTHGATHGLELIFRTLIQSPGDVIIVGRPTYRWALENIMRVGGGIVSVGVDDDGFDVSELERTLGADPELASRVKAVYTMPTFQNPTGVCMSVERRTRLMSLAAEHKFYVIEDDAYWSYCDAPQPMTLAVHDVGNMLIHVGSFSKTVAPGLRLGWIASRTGLIDRIVAWLPNAANPYVSAVVRETLVSAGLQRRLAASRKAVEINRQLTVQLLAAKCPDVTFLNPRGGFYVFCRLPCGVHEAGLVQECRRGGVAVMPGSGFMHSNSSNSAHVRICYAGMRTSEVSHAIGVLSQRIRHLQRVGVS